LSASASRSRPESRPAAAATNPRTFLERRRERPSPAGRERLRAGRCQAAGAGAGARQATCGERLNGVCIPSAGRLMTPGRLQTVGVSLDAPPVSTAQATPRAPDAGPQRRDPPEQDDDKHDDDGPAAHGNISPWNESYT